MGEIVPPESKRRPTPSRADDPHASVTIAPPAPAAASDAWPPTPSLGPTAAHFDAALAAGSRTSSSLTELSRLVAELSSGLSGAMRANEQLARELAALRALLSATSEQNEVLAGRVAELERALTESEEGAQRERQFLTEQQDQFLAALLEEHEAAQSLPSGAAAPARPESESRADSLASAEAALARAVAEREVAEAARFAIESELSRAHEALFRAQQARDEAQARADKRERERDELRAEASQLRARLGTSRPTTAPPPPVAPASKPPFAAAAALTLDDGELDSNLHPRAGTPRVPSVVPRFGVPALPERPRSSPSSSPEATATPFPRESTRPGVGGPKPPPSFGPPPSGWTPPPPPAEQPTPSLPRVQSAANLPPGLPGPSPVMRQKPDPATRPLIDYSLGEGGVQSELLEGARLSSKPPRK